jgi:hypothetical protein
MGLTKIVIRGARQHNLKNISLEIPRNTLTVITGLSGSGKSSLAFDTIYAEGQRRYVESLSAYARQFLDQMERPEVDSIEGLSPSIAIEQKTTTRSPRSTVGTITEIYDYLRVVYSSIGTPHCPKCGKPISRQSTDQIVRSILQGELAKSGDRIMILAPIVRGERASTARNWKNWRATASCARASTATCARSTIRRASTSARITPSKCCRPPAGKARHRRAARAIDRHGAEAGEGTRHRRRGRRHRAGFFRKNGLQRMRHFRAAARAALVQLQFAVRRVPGVQRPGLEIRFRSVEGDR